MTRFFSVIVVSFFAFLFLISEALFTVDEREKVLVLQFGEATSHHDKPGLNVKIPFIQTLVRYDARLLGYNLPALEVTAGDQKRVVVDLFIRYRIKNTLLFYRKVFNDKGAQNRLSTIVDASMRRVIGRVPLDDMLSSKRSHIMGEILKEVVLSANDFGVEVEDVRIINFDLPKENLEAIFQRMETERRQEARQFRAEGEQRAQEIRSDADRQKTIIIARAQRDAEIKRGEGDALASKIYADAFSQDPEFYEFYRTLEVYRQALKEQTSFILNKEDAFFKYLHGGR
jgi:membrane protease subunit HflC